MNSEITSKYIEIDGHLKATKNSLGDLIHETVNGIENFWRWFGQSKSVDEHGRPLVFFHGGHFNPNSFQSFDPDLCDESNDLGAGFYFSSCAKDASRYDYNQEYGEPSVLSVYIKMENPYNLKVPSKGEMFRQSIAVMGHDSIIDRTVPYKFKDEGYFPGEEIVHIVAFYPEQIKATMNSGAFNAKTANIYDSKRPSLGVSMEP
jgi:ADP-Ribosyltransferase in polyvalent proteins